MPTYTFLREDGSEITRRLTFSEYSKVKAGSIILKDIDGSSLSLVFNPGHIGFNLKDGESGSWPSKAGREKIYRQKRHQVMGRRQKDHVFQSKLIPNYMGQETGSWREAQNMAATDRDVDHDIRSGLAKGYDALVAKEGSKS